LTKTLTNLETPNTLVYAENINSLNFVVAGYKTGQSAYEKQNPQSG